MLLFWDLHINSRIVDRVVDCMKDWISQNSDEKNLIFLWDYVYHFSYDREALLKLYSFFLELYQWWKNVYILAWNHDWLGNTFVFEEAKRTYDIIKNVFHWDENGGKIEFITQPKVEQIEWEDILFLPYCLEIKIPLGFPAKAGHSADNPFKKGDTVDTHLIEIEGTMNTLLKSQNKNEKFSAELNKLLLEYYQKYGKLTVIHHYYIEWVTITFVLWIRRIEIDFWTFASMICIQKLFLYLKCTKYITIGS